MIRIEICNYFNDQPINSSDYIYYDYYLLKLDNNHNIPEELNSLNLKNEGSIVNNRGSTYFMFFDKDILLKIKLIVGKIELLDLRHGKFQ